MELKNRKISRKFCFYAIIFLSVIFQTKSGCSHIQIWFIYHSWKFESCSFNRGRVTALYVSKNDKSEVHWSEIPEQAAVQHDQIMHTACIGELNAMHFKQTLNRIINLPQEHSNYTSCHELCPYDVNIARPVSVPFQNQNTDPDIVNDYIVWTNSWQEV